MSIFTSSNWLKTCQDCWPTTLGWEECRLSLQGDRYAQCLLGRRKIRRHFGLINARSVALNQSLDPLWDQVFIEYNGFTGSSAADFAYLLKKLLSDLSDDPAWDEFRLSGLTIRQATAATGLAHDFGLKVRQTDFRPTFSRNLVEDRSAGGILPGLSSNTRAQLRKSRRLIESRCGPIRVESAQTVEEAVQWFEALAPWHRYRWGARAGRNGSSGFDNPAFIRFHRTLIKTAFADDQIRLWRLFAGEQLIAGLYNFRWTGTEAFYLGATDPSLDPAFRPGLLSHQSVMECCLTDGIEFYDFMAGDSQYKRQLSNRQSELAWLVLQRPRLKFRIEDGLRALRDAVKGKTSAPRTA